MKCVGHHLGLIALLLLLPTFAFASPSGFVIIVGPPDTAIFLDNQAAVFVGETGYLTLPASAGDHIVRAELAGYLPWIRAVTVAPLLPLMIEIQLEPAPDETQTGSALSGAFKSILGSPAVQSQIVSPPLAPTDTSGLASDILNIRTLAGTKTTFSAGAVPWTMIFVPAASFPKGWQDDAMGTVYDSFWIGETEVTYRLWHAVRTWALDNGYTMAPGREGSNGDSGLAPSEAGSEPVTVVSWWDCIVWCNALSEMLGFDPVYREQWQVIRNSTARDRNANTAAAVPANGFRLPTSDEWELAARYRGSDSSYGAIALDNLYWSPGNYASGATANTEDREALAEAVWFQGNSNGHTHPVAQKVPNALGIYDLTGNVWEYCSNWILAPGYNVERPFIRGGGFFNVSYDMNVGSLHTTRPDHDDNQGVGFRLARTFR